ncbi:hypothetical protein [Wenxinia saemankumensis]|uniref:Uncharacterized protein n=1 Tax=Wenxinia saemankumensis TaxID=1447782 RepID=A0A1M6CAE6_9RHOB|nr:hypothetical protein [Wenxinia saemankumensis]SHI57977.1 hypothetical protein SAMN05444417_1094 [Wenxinia saemankumensis]
MTRRAPLAALLLALLAGPGAAETRHLCWRGEGGYTMTGSFTFPDSLATATFVGEGDVTAMSIEGFRDGAPLGSWTLDPAAPPRSWLLRYNAAEGRFYLGDTGDGLYQMWNADGYVDDCGSPGFGFNAGNGGQDVCVDGVYQAESTIFWDTPLLSYAAPRDPLTCSNAPLLGKAPR